MLRIELGFLIIVILKLKMSSSVDWGAVKCSSDIEQEVPEGKVPIGRFPWLGVVQHTFYLGEKSRFAVTSGILIHPGYAIAAAEDIARVPRTQLFNNTRFVMWHSGDLKFAVDVQDYLLHPEYEHKVTFATLALLELYTSGETGISDFPSATLPVCLPLSGLGTFDRLFSVRFTDDDGELHKEANKMNYIPNTECEEYYYKAGLSSEMMKPRRPLCAAVESQSRPCVWDAGSALIVRQTWGHWMILGFSMRGAGCGAPARYVSMHDFIPWIDDVITKLGPHEMDRTVKMNFRRISPVAFHMYPSDVKIPKNTGQCLDSKQRGPIIYKENSEVISTKNFGQGFYFISVLQAAAVNCIQVELDVLARSNAAVWVEHLCQRDMTNLHHGAWQGMDITKLECFMYFKTKTYIEVRFFFSFRAQFEVSIYGKIETTKFMPNPFQKYETTIPWHPTDNGLHKYLWHPAAWWQWYM